MSVFKSIIAIISLGLLGATVLLLFISGTNYIIDNVPVTCYVNNNLVYKGRSACLNISTSGATTTVQVSDGLFCLSPKAYYVSNNVKVEGEK